MAERDKIMRILIVAKDAQTLRVLLEEQRLDLACAGPQQQEGGAVSVEAYVPEPQMERLAQYGAKVEVLDDASATARERQKEVGRGNRFEGKNRVPRGLGRKLKGDDNVS
jgi:hypothetical protein